MSLKIQQNRYLRKTESYIQDHFQDEGSGHDWWHIYRVRNVALKLAEIEGGNKFIIEMAALLHDLDDWKLNGESEVSKTKRWLDDLGILISDKNKILEIIGQVSFKGAGVGNKAISIEAKLVQDADRLDAIGAIGIARTFAYGGSKGRLIYHPGIKPEMYDNFEEYKRNTAPSINHFYEKLLLLKNLLNTNSAKKMAEKRHRFMEDFLTQFYAEWRNKM
ncbi:MAG: HD domain-containing protein [Draconibacterium sp.]|nr:HD domain-containing protein [Draconibacterium sp.]